jgi:aldose 1-epimerase
MRLSAHCWELDLLPHLGGAIGALRHAGHDVLRAAPADAGSPLDAGCFPLVPYANRIAHGTFHYAGQEYRLPRNFGDHPHSLHGVGWQATWSLETVRGDLAVMRHTHAGGGGWPWPYRAEQRIVLNPRRTSIELSLTNTSDAAMPAGLGLHPYFPRDRDTKLTFRAEAMWLADGTMLPTVTTTPDQYGDWAAGAAVDGGTLIDNAFAGWDGRARIAQAWGAIDIRAADAGVLHIYRPPGETFFCAEPVSHLPDAINRGGMPLLAPGATHTVTMTLQV